MKKDMYIFPAIIGKEKNEKEYSVFFPVVLFFLCVLMVFSLYIYFIFLFLVCNLYVDCNSPDSGK